MAKYVLNRLSNNYTNCAVLDENCLSNTYTVQFNNGIIKNVSKSRVYDLDALDEGVLSKLREVAGKLLDKVIKAGKYVYVKLKDRILSVNTPFVAMAAAQEIDGVGFYASDALVERGNSVKVNVVDVDDIAEGDEIADNINSFYTKVKKYYEDRPELLEESANARPMTRRHTLYEADEYDLEDKNFRNITRTELYEELIQAFMQYSEQGAGDPRGNGSDPTPLLIWGAPGIGKTDVVKGFIKSIKDEGIPASMIYLNLITFRRDDFALPAYKQVEKVIKIAKDAVAKTASEEGFNTKVLKKDTVVEVPKTWLPLVDPADIDEDNGITYDVLDDLANGGDGSGNGEGGIIFVDELSRVSVDVMNVLMTLIQQREFNGGILGSKWMFVFAANRYIDMGDNAENFNWEDAWGGRFDHVNFTPTFAEWLDWAKKSKKIHPSIIAFLEEHPAMWRSPKLKHDDEENPVNKYPEPREWEKMSKLLFGKEAARDILSGKSAQTSKFAGIAKKLGVDKSFNRGVLSATDYENAALMTVGRKAANAVRDWASFDKLFTPAIATSVWTMGDKAQMPVRPNAVNIKGMIEKILANHPNYNPTNVDMTSKEFENLVDYIIALVDSTNEQNSGAKDGILTAARGHLSLELMKAPFGINLAQLNAAQSNKYNDGLVKLSRRMMKTRATMKSNQ